jgi:hypothetical protein
LAWAPKGQGPLAHPPEHPFQPGRLLLRVGVEFQGQAPEGPAGQAVEVLPPGPPVDQEEVHVAGGEGPALGSGPKEVGLLQGDLPGQGEKAFP